MISKKQKLFLLTSTIFLSLFLFYKWQLATSNYYLTEGNNIHDAKNYNEALKKYKYAEAISGNRNITYEAKIKRAEIFYERWQLDQAEKELLEAINEKQNNYKAYEILGDVYLAKREFAKSKNNYNQAIKLNGDSKFNLKLIKCLIANQELDLAFNTLLDLQKDNLENDDNELLYYLGLIDLDKNTFYNDYFESLEDDENYRNKIIEIKKVLEIYDDQKNSDYNAVLIADLYNKIGEPYFAINRINAVTKNNPSYRDAWIISGKSNFIIGNYEKSLSDFEKALDLDSNNLEIIFWIASIYNETKNLSS